MSTLVQKAAPDFKATAVVNGQFKEINLSHRGQLSTLDNDGGHSRRVRSRMSQSWPTPIGPANT